VNDYVAINLANWNSRVPHHERGYGLEAFRADNGHLSDVVRFDLPRLGSIEGLDVVHLRCHIGTDTLSLARLSARTVTGLDFSAPALAVAAQLASDCGATIDYVESELYGAVDALGAARFDLVFTGIGALCWLPSVSRWAQVVADLLVPGGRLFIREGHPVLWSLGYERPDRLLVLEYPYFEREQPLVWDDPGTYVETDAEFKHTLTHEWNHGLGEIVTALFDAGMQLTMLVEHDSVPWEPLPGQMVKDEHGEWRLAEGSDRVPLSYTLQAVKRG
jgi:SAM-dependent methyltransferase